MTQPPLSLKDIYDTITKPNNDVITSKVLQDTYQLTHFEASCVLYMMKEGEYFPELEGLYYPNPAEKQNRCGEIEFIKDIFPYKKNDISGINDDNNPLEDEDMESYVSHGFAKWIIPPEEFNQKQIHLYVHITRHSNKVKADLSEAITNRDVDFFRVRFHGFTKEKTIEFLKQFECSDEEMGVVLGMFFLDDDEL